MHILDLLDTKPITLILPFAPTYTQQIFTRFESIALGLDSDQQLPHHYCNQCNSSSLASYHYLCVSYDQLMSSMVRTLTPLCLRRAIRAINTMTGTMNEEVLYYESYAMFNILFNVVDDGENNE